MHTTTLGSTDITVSRLCLGTMTWGNGQLGKREEENAHAQMEYALAQGIHFWDTAEMYAVPPTAQSYGQTETLIGTWFAKTGRRKEVVLASKAATTGRPWIRSGAPLTATTMKEAVEGSLKRLQTDYLDLYQLHWPTRPYPHHQQHWHFAPATNTAEQVEHMHELLHTAGELIQAGKIRAFGLSNDTAWGLMTYLRLAEKFSLPRIASMQNEYSLLYRLDDMYMEEACALENVAFLPYSPLAMGILTGKYQNGAAPPNSRATLPGNSTRNRLTPQSEAATQAYMELAAHHHLTPTQLALAFTLTRPFVTSTILGATTLEQLKEDIAAAQTPLPPEILPGIDKIRRQYPISY